jgi:predicted N-acetyltransferase YhbS
MQIEIENLKNHPEYVDTVVKWLFSEWGNDNFQFWYSWVKSSLSSYDIPKTYIAFLDKRLVGTYSLWRCDLQSCQDLFPWFGGLYVDSNYRGKEYNGCKLGVYMQKHAIKELRALGYKQVYLFTEKSPKYYIDNGWKLIGTVPDETDMMVSLCKYWIDEVKNERKQN